MAAPGSDAGFLRAVLELRKILLHGSVRVASRDQVGQGSDSSHDPRTPAVPFKANAARRHRIPRQRHRVTNWAEYYASLRQRGSSTVWFTEEAVAAWRAEPRTTRGGQPWYSPLAILTAGVVAWMFEGQKSGQSGGR